jgi:hypothetical protein
VIANGGDDTGVFPVSVTVYVPGVCTPSKSSVYTWSKRVLHEPSDGPTMPVSAVSPFVPCTVKLAPVSSRWDIR